MAVNQVRGFRSPPRRNLHRRHLIESQRAMVAGKVATLKWGQTKARETNLSLSIPDAAQKLNVGKVTVKHARAVLERGTPALVSAVEKGGETPEPYPHSVHAHH